MTKEIIVYADYVCPFCLLAEKIIRDEIEGTDIGVRWRPHELRPYPVPTLKIEDEYLPSIWKSSVYPMAANLNVPIRLPKISPQPRTSKPFEAFVFADQFKLGDEFSMAVLAAFFQKGLDIGNIEVLSDLGLEIGLDRNKLKEILINEDFKEDHQRALYHALYEENITVVPTVIIGKQKFEGVPSKTWLRNALSHFNKEG